MFLCVFNLYKWARRVVDFLNYASKPLSVFVGYVTDVVYGVFAQFEHGVVFLRIREFNGKDMSKEDFKTALKELLTTTNIEDVKTDVRPFLKNGPQELDVWSNDYFLQLADRIVFKE